MTIQYSPFRIAIVGGGIGGLFAALSLEFHCPKGSIHIDVYEQALEYKEIGAGIGIGINAARLLHQIGIGDSVNTIAGHRNGVWISFRRYDTGAEIVTVPVNDRDKIRQCPVHRADFLDLLVHHVKARNAAKLHTNKQCCDVIDRGHGAILRFQDGTEATADLVIGCDGIHSSIRSLFRSDNPRYSGRIAFRGLIQIRDIEEWWPFQTYSVSWLGLDKHFLVFPISRNTILNVVAFVSAARGDKKESWSAVGDRSELAGHFTSFDPVVKRIVSLMPRHPSKWVLNDREPLEQWVFASGHVVLAGDAAHAMLPHQGAGAGQAIEDGYILGRAVLDYLTPRGHTAAPLEKWMDLYQRVRFPRAQKAQATAREAGLVYEMQTPEMVGKSYEECLGPVSESLKNRMKWVWDERIDDAYEAMRETMLAE